MSLHHRLLANDRFYTVADDLTLTYAVLAFGRVTDEVSGLALAPGFRVAVERSDLQVKVMPDGWFAISGAPARVLPPSGPASLSLIVRLSATGYADAVLTVSIPSSAPLAISLRPNPVRVQGRVMGSVSGVPVVGAQITLVDDPTAPPPAEHLLALRAPLRADHPAGVTVRACALPPAGPARALFRPAAAGARTLTLDSRAGLGAGDVLAFGPELRREYAVVASISPLPANPALPGDVTLQAPLAQSLEPGATVQKTNPAPGAPTAQLARPAAAGDGLLILDAVLNTASVQVADPVATRVEYHAVGALADADGYYRLDGMGRVPEIFLQATSGPHTAVRALRLRFEQPVNSADLYLHM